MEWMSLWLGVVKPPGLNGIFRSYLFYVLLLLVPAHVAMSQESSSVYHLPRIDGPITIDGYVDEPAWEAIDPIPLVSHWPTFGDPAEDGTELRIGYDGDYVYVSCRCYADPAQISAPTYKRDKLEMYTDGVSLLLDTFNDKENALWFTVTPTGSRADVAVSNDAVSIAGNNPTNTYWNSIWEAEANITDFGWTMEMRIPFSSLRFESANGRVVMGLSAYQYSACEVRLYTFPAIPPEWGFWSFVKPSQFQQVVLEDISNHNPVDVTPYLLGGVERNASINPETGSYRHTSDGSYEPGVDIKMGLSNNVTLDLTANTDFAQVEADNQQLNLTRFSLFFPERRPFFLERASIFDFTFAQEDRLFYSRRIGLSEEGQPLRILGGARMVARTGGWDIGLMSMQTARELGMHSENHSIVRLRKQLGNPQSYAGGIVTSRIDEGGNYNIAYGMDGIFNIRNDDFLNFNIAHTADREANISVLDSESVRLRTEWERRTFNGFSYNFNFNYSGRTYEPGMGFQLRNDYMRFGDRVSYGWQADDKSALQRGRVSVNGSLFLRNRDGSLQTATYGPSVQLTWKRGDFATGLIQMVTEDIVEPFNLADDVEIPAGQYSFPEAGIAYETPRGRGLRAAFNLRGGGFFDGNRFTASVQPEWSLSSVTQIDLFYQFNRVRFDNRQQKLDAHIGRLRTEFTFNTKFTLSSFIQYNSTDHLGIVNLRFRFNPRDGNDFYLVFNETLNSNRDRLTPRMPLSDYRAVFLKYNHTFRF